MASSWRAPVWCRTSKGRRGGVGRDFGREGEGDGEGRGGVEDGTGSGVKGRCGVERLGEDLCRTGEGRKERGVGKGEEV